MPERIMNPAVIEAAGNKPKRIEEYVGRVRTQTATVSVARMTSPAGWEEPAQTPEFDEVTLVLRGVLRVDGAGGPIEVGAGEAVLARAGETVRYATPDGAEYVAVCAPAFSPALVHRHESDSSIPTPASGLPTLQVVGRLRSPVADTVDEGWSGVEATIELEPPYHGATRGLADFSHVVIVYLLHQARYESARHRVRRPRNRTDMPDVGIFAQRAKDRPNPIGLTAVELVRVEDERIVVRGLDAIDGTPILDVKPYVPAYDRIEAPRVPEWIDRLMHGYF
jgi:tRNA-Thr(GGU) m(6)t(6)A37 methyltransferase TsaA